MTKKCPIFPKPAKSRLSYFKLFFKKQHSFLDGLFENSYRMKMGKIQFFKLKLFMVNQLELVKKILVQSPYDFPKHTFLGKLLEPLLGESIFTTNGEKWAKQRDMVMPAFKNARVDLIFDRMQAAVSVLMTRLAQHKPGSVIDIDHEMTLVTADIIFRTIMSTNLDSEDAQIILDAFVRFQARSTKHTIMRVFFGSFDSWLMRFIDRKRREDAQIIRAAVSRIIAKRYDEKEDLDAPQDDILSALFKAEDPDTGKPFEMKEVIDQVIMLFLAGHETSAAALSWTIYLLAISPDEQEKAFQEVSKIVSLGGEINLSQIKEMKVVEYAFMEALRLYPPIGFFVRESVQPVCLRDKMIQPGDPIIISPWLIHRHEDFWEKPHEFCPMRFDKSKGKKIRNYAYLPFSLGPRQCIGMAFATREAMLVLATLLRTYRFDLAPGFEPEPVGRISIRSNNGMQVILSKRGE